MKCKKDYINNGNESYKCKTSYWKMIMIVVNKECKPCNDDCEKCNANSCLVCKNDDECSECNVDT